MMLHFHRLFVLAATLCCFEFVPQTVHAGSGTSSNANGGKTTKTGGIAAKSVTSGGTVKSEPPAQKKSFWERWFGSSKSKSSPKSLITHNGKTTGEKKDDASKFTIPPDSAENSSRISGNVDAIDKSAGAVDDKLAVTPSLTVKGPKNMVPTSGSVIDDVNGARRELPPKLKKAMEDALKRFPNAPTKSFPDRSDKCWVPEVGKTEILKNRELTKCEREFRNINLALPCCDGVCPPCPKGYVDMLSDLQRANGLNKRMNKMFPVKKFGPHQIHPGFSVGAGVQVRGVGFEPVSETSARSKYSEAKETLHGMNSASRSV